MGKTASVFIDGEISYDSYLNSIAAIRQTLEWQGQFDDISVTINSNGGDIAEGLGIYDLLRSYGKPIRTIIIGQCCSAASIVFLAGDSRLIYENVVAFMIHKASCDIIGTVTADDARQVADLIDGYNVRMATITKEKTGADDELITEWFSKDTFMNAEEALTNGFATAIAKPVQAKFYAKLPHGGPSAKPAPSSNQIPIEQTMKIIKDKVERIATSITARIENPEVKATKVTTDDGQDLNIAYAGDSMAEGDEVTLNGEAAPDGTYTIDGVKVVVKGGVIDSIDTSDESTDPTASDKTKITASDETETEEEEEGEETEAEELARLRTENSDLNKRVTAMEKGQNTIKAQMTALLGSKVSKDPAVPAPRGTKKKIQAKVEEALEEEDQQRQDMLDEREAKGLGITVEQLREKEGR